MLKHKIVVQFNKHKIGLICTDALFFILVYQINLLNFCFAFQIMQSFQEIKTNIPPETQTDFAQETFVKTETVQNVMNKTEEDNSDCPPRRNGLFSITGNLKFHRHIFTGRCKLEINAMYFSPTNWIIRLYICKHIF